MLERYVIHVTKQCNMQCVYCYEDDKETIYTWKEIKSFVDNLLLNSPKEFGIEFLGGEPMLRWDLVVKTYEYLEKNSKEKHIDSYGITTNGTILPDEALNYMLNNRKLHWAVSLDGHEFANQLRIMKDGNKNSYSIVIPNLKRAMKAGLRYGIHMVTHPYNVAFIYDSINHLYGLGVRSIDLGTVEKTMGIGEDYNRRFIEELNKVSMSILSGKFKELSIGLFNSVKPIEDVRCYIRDASGKLIAESYGRAGKDVTYNSEYEVMRCEEPTRISHYIHHIRLQAYENHQRNKEEFNV